jgi:hypothetical protein
MTGEAEGGEAPCFAHLLDGSPQLSDESAAGLLGGLADAVVIDTGPPATRRRTVPTLATDC